MIRRRMTPVAAAAILAAGLAGCVDSAPPDRPTAGPSTSPTASPTASPSATSPGPSADEPESRDPRDPSALADAWFWVGPPEIVMGPSSYVDSPLTAIKVGDTVRAYVGNVDSVLLEGSTVADLVPTDRVVLERGARTAFDWCGAWLDAVEQDQRDPDLLRAWYHAEADCAYTDHQTHKSIAYAESRDGGLTFTKPGYPDNQVVRSPTGSAQGHHTGRGAPSVIRRGGHFYMYYFNVLPDLSTVTSVARAPVASGGVPGTWRNYSQGGWSATALGGPADALDTARPARSASIYSPSGEVVLMRQNSRLGGIRLQSSTDGIHFAELPEPLVPIHVSQVRADWGSGTDGEITGYVSIVAADGSRSWADEFYLFHLYVFPGDELRGGRYLVRRRVVVDRASDGGPWSAVALSEYDASTQDRYATSAPVKPDAEAGEVIGYLLATPAADRKALFECVSARGDRFVTTACGATASKGRLAGYAFASKRDETVLLVRCTTEAGDQFVALEDDCADDARAVSDLGYVYPPSS